MPKYVKGSYVPPTYVARCRSVNWESQVFSTKRFRRLTTEKLAEEYEDRLGHVPSGQNERLSFLDTPIECLSTGMQYNVKPKSEETKK